MGKGLLELLGGEANAVRLGKRQAVLLDVVGDGTLDLGDLVAGTGEKPHDADPEHVLHAGAHDGGPGLLGDGVQSVGGRSRGGPGEGRLLAGGHDGDAAADALLDHGRNVVYQREERDDGDVGRALVKDLVGVVRDLDAELHGQTSVVAGIHAHARGVGVDGTDQLPAVLVQVADGVLGHLSASVLDNPDWPLTHWGLLPSSL